MTDHSSPFLSGIHVFIVHYVPYVINLIIAFFVREREREIMIRMHKTIGKLRILYSNYNTQETNQKQSSEK